MTWKRPEFTDLRVGQQVVVHRYDDGFNRGAVVERIRVNTVDYVIDCRFGNGTMTAVYRDPDGTWRHGAHRALVGLAGVLTDPKPDAPEPERMTETVRRTWAGDSEGLQEAW